MTVLLYYCRNVRPVTTRLVRKIVECHILTPRDFKLEGKPHKHKQTDCTYCCVRIGSGQNVSSPMIWHDSCNILLSTTKRIKLGKKNAMYVSINTNNAKSRHNQYSTYTTSRGTSTNTSTNTSHSSGQVMLLLLRYAARVNETLNS